MGEPFIIAEDEALKLHLQGMTVSDNLMPSRPVKVWFGYPDVEVRDQAFPFVTIDLIDIAPGSERQTYGFLTDDDYRGSIAPEPGVYYSYHIPVAYDLVYQVTSYSRHPYHDRALMRQLYNKFPSKYGHLEVPVQLGTYSTSRHMFLDGFTKRDAVEGETGNRRLLRNVYTVRVLSQMTPEVADAVAAGIVETVNVNTTTSYIPSELTPVPSFVLPEN